MKTIRLLILVSLLGILTACETPSPVTKATSSPEDLANLKRLTGNWSNTKAAMFPTHWRFEIDGSSLVAQQVYDADYAPYSALKGDIFGNPGRLRLSGRRISGILDWDMQGIVTEDFATISYRDWPNRRNGRVFQPGIVHSPGYEDHILRRNR